MATLAEQLRAQGGDWNIGGIDRAQELADLLGKKGITSLDGLKLNKETIKGSWQEGGSGGETPDAGYMSADSFKHTLTAGGKTIGFAGDYNNDGSYGGGKWEGYDRLQDVDGREDAARVGWSARGDGGVSYNVEVGADGKVKIVPVWGSTSDKERIQRGIVGAAGVIAAPFALNAGLTAAGFGTAGAESGMLSGMDLAADAALGAGNNITTAAGMLGSDAAAIGGGDLIGEAVGEAAGGAGTPSYSAASNYGPGMTGAQTGAFDSVLAATGSTGAANVAGNIAGGDLLGSLGAGWDWLSSAGSLVSSGGKLFGNTLSSDLMKLIGAGVSQYSAENATQEQRDWIDKQLSDKRRRQKPVATPGMFFTVNKGKNG